MNENDKLEIDAGIDVTKKNANEKQEYDFIPRLNHWLSIDEQKEKTKEIEDKTSKDEK